MLHNYPTSEKKTSSHYQTLFLCANYKYGKKKKSQCVSKRQYETYPPYFRALLRINNSGKLTFS